MADYQAHIKEFQNKNIALFAVSVDSQKDAVALMEQLNLSFPLGYGLDFMAFAEQTGAFYEIRRSIIHATAFILKADGTVAHAVYATGPAGRLSAEDCLRVIG